MLELSRVGQRMLMPFLMSFGMTPLRQAVAGKSGSRNQIGVVLGLQTFYILVIHYQLVAKYGALMLAFFIMGKVEGRLTLRM
jgi:uncharacterized membrane protein